MENGKWKRREEASLPSSSYLLILLARRFCATPQLTKRLEEAIGRGVSLRMEQSDVTSRAPQEHVPVPVYTKPEEFENRGLFFESGLPFTRQSCTQT